MAKKHIDIFTKINMQNILMLDLTLKTKPLFAILIGILCAIFLSSFIYFEHFLNAQNLPIYSTLSAIFGFYLYFKLTHLGAFVCGGTIGLLWFYWIALSFRYYDLSAFIPLALVGIFCVYGVLFLIFCWFKNPFYRLIALSLSSYIKPFGFNWFILESIFVKSEFAANFTTLFLSLLIVLICSLLLHKKFIKSSFLLGGILFLSLKFILPSVEQNPQNIALKIKTIHTKIPQQLRFKQDELNKILKINFDLIQVAKQDGYEVVILPETAFPLVLNKSPLLLESLKEQSKDITIITGALKESSGQIFNSAYVFFNGSVTIIDKLILVPFGEQIPFTNILPQSLKKWINKTFFNGAADFSSNDFKEPNTIKINGILFNLAICYEATREEFYKNNPQALIAISNNAWFAPSTQETLQKLLMLYFAKRFHTTIYHSSNASSDFILKP